MAGFKGEVYTKRRTDTKTQVKKHVKQMGKEDIVRCCVLLKDINQLKRSRHLIKKGVKFSFNSIIQTLKNPNLHQNIIEYNETYKPNKDRWEQRVLINVPNEVEFKTDRGVLKGYLKAVINVTTKEVVTVYFNETKDTHKSLNLDYYNNKLKIRPKKSGGYKNINPGIAKDYQLKEAK